MIKRRIVYSASSLLSALAIVGCNFKGNTDMQTDSKVNCVKWDAFANKVGIQTCDQAIPVTNKKAIVEYLSKPPENFDPKSSKYNEVTGLVEKYVKEMAPKSQATEIVSVKKLSVVLEESGFKDREVIDGKEFSVPYFERDKTDKTEKDVKVTVGTYQDLSRVPTLSGIDKDSGFEIYSTKEGFRDKSESATGTAYVLTYKLFGSVQNYSAIVTVPDKVTNPLPLIMYAHGGDAGLSFRNMAMVLQNNLSKGIVAAPSFPGEPICAITTIGGHAGNKYQRNCGDILGKIMPPAVKGEGDKSPLNDDVNAFLGLHNAIARLAIDKSSNKLIKSNNVDQKFLDSLTKLDFYSKNPTLAAITGPKTIGLSDSRGGATLLAAIGRTGIMLKKSVLSGGLGNIDLNKLPMPVLFSSCALYYTPSSLLLGSFRLVTQDLVAGNVHDTSTLNALPMIPDLKKNSFFTNYRAKSAGQDQKELNELVGWMGASDISFLAPYISVAMQNWTVGLDSLGKRINFGIEQLIVGLSAGTDNPTKPVYDVLNNLTTEIESGKGKSLLTYIAETLKAGAANPPTGDGALKCNFKTDLKSCSIYNILVNGQEEAKDIDGAGTEIPKLDPFIDKSNVLIFAEFLNELGKQNAGIQQILTGADKISPIFKILGIANKLNIGLDKIEPLLIYLASANIILMKQNMDSSNPNSNISIGSQAFLAINSINNFKTNKKIIIDTLLSKKDLLPKIFATRKTAPGSIIFLHSTQDTVVPYTQSVIAKKAMDKVFDAVYGEQTLTINPLTESQVPAIGSQLFAFQPDDSFYTVNVGDKTIDGNICLEKSFDGFMATNYNPTVKKCFGNRRLPLLGDGLTAHGDSAVRTSRLISSSLQKLDYKNDKSKIIDSLLYGNQTFDLAKENALPAFSANISKQFETFNKFKKSYSANCDPAKITGICYIFNPDVNAIVPLFNRTLEQDVEFHLKSIPEGKWDKFAQANTLTPTDIVGLWIDSSAQKAMEPISN